jgi:hypothetical protein
VDLVGQLDASPAGTFQALEHVTVTGGHGRDTASVRTEPQWWLRLSPRVRDAVQHEG